MKSFQSLVVVLSYHHFHPYCCYCPVLLLFVSYDYYYFAYYHLSFYSHFVVVLVVDLVCNCQLCKYLVPRCPVQRLVCQEIQYTCCPVGLHNLYGHGHLHDQKLIHANRNFSCSVKPQKKFITKIQVSRHLRHPYKQSKIHTKYFSTYLISDLAYHAESANNQPNCLC